ncbi:signal peptidase II [Fontisphaera persica]|jgi:signal peptidase II|uniref:signal peptidase II n=1 Tax=Fontisphaera persica TaxID=2974023 RepID=UPI0024C09AC2|nr:signal peptidase II [Fontisphaera persica]WCJ58617.1 signal peptidase II [Fontisphaera persica]
MLTQTSNGRTAVAAVAALALDQLTKLAVVRFLDFQQEQVVLDGFFKLVHWGNTGAAWSLFRDNNALLAIVSLVALLILLAGRRHFDTGTRLGDYAMGMVLGGIIGNIIDRFAHGHVVDFLYFHLYRRSGEELGFPAFNLADSAICIGVLILFILSLQTNGQPAAKAAETPPGPPA